MEYLTWQLAKLDVPHLSSNYAIKWLDGLLKIPPHLKHIATLPGEILSIASEY